MTLDPPAEPVAILNSPVSRSSAMEEEIEDWPLSGVNVVGGGCGVAVMVHGSRSCEGDEDEKAGEVSCILNWRSLPSRCSR